jgi:hypothetical protein
LVHSKKQLLESPTSTKWKTQKMDMNKEKFHKMFPNLAKEMEKGTCETKIHAVRSDSAAAEKAVVSKKFAGYNPDAIDFLRRCDTAEQSEEIICYLEKRQEISPGYAKKLRKQLKTKGVRSFGAKKEDDYYLKQDGF